MGRIVPESVLGMSAGASSLAMATWPPRGRAASNGVARGKRTIRLGKKMFGANEAQLGFQAELWTADTPCGSMDAGKHKYVVLGLIFLRHIRDGFAERYAHLESEHALGSDAEDPEAYRVANVFWAPREGRWTRMQKNVRRPEIDTLVDSVRRHAPHGRLLPGVAHRSDARRTARSRAGHAWSSRGEE